ncbi:MAG TPA: calcium/sodium antiporter [Nitrospina sp.]|jgi:cation:H+ antiporter|nr:calcium/sodium antiporter [Nitrospina sp.]
MLINSGLIFVGLFFLYYGGELLVTGSLRLAQSFKISPFIIGATVIGFGTSTPELAVSLMASLQDSGDLALGNVIGSNITNIGLVLGLTALIVPLTIEKQRFIDESPPLIITSLIIVVFAWNNYLGRTEGFIMICLLVIYLWRAFQTKEKTDLDLSEDHLFSEYGGSSFQTLLVILGIIMLILGANWMVEGATGIARKLGVSEWFIGVSIVALGTSLPELISSLIAAKKGHGEMAIGNVFGSNIFNILMVIGTTSLVQPLSIGEEIYTDLIYTTALTCLLLLLIGMGNVISKRDGIILIVCYGAYVGLKGTGLL